MMSTVSSLPFDHPEARIAFDVVIGLFVVSEVWIRMRSNRNPDGSRLDRKSLQVVKATAVAGVAGAVFLERRAPGLAIARNGWPLFVTGLVLMCVGIAIRQWAVAVLGRFFTIEVRVQTGHTVVEGGPYRWVRHPSYTGLILTFLGLGLTLDNWGSLAVIAVVPTAGLVYRIHFEERALLEGLGEPYRQFAQGRARLVPGIW
jgi:protein-S-isoprenylcysteine O-methyltransferase Ste14